LELAPPQRQNSKASLQPVVLAAVNHLTPLSEFVATLTYAQLPREVVSRIKCSVLDTLGCGLHGSLTPWGRIVADYATASDGRSTVWGRPAAGDLEHAVLANATMVHSFELDDLHMPSRSHPGGITIPAALAMAEDGVRVTGQDLIAAVAAGYEVLIRVGMAQGVSSFDRGWHPTGTAGCFGSAATVSRLLGLNAEAVQHALGIAGTMPCGLMAAQYGAMVKRLFAGHASSVGVLAAKLAQKGFTGIPDVFDAEFGGYLEAVSDQVDASQLTEGLGTTYRTAEMGYKLYACVGASHTAIDAARQILAQQPELDAATIREVRVVTSEYQRTHAGWPYVPSTVMAAQMSIQYCIAAMIRFGEVFVDQFAETLLADPGLVALANKVSVVADPAQSPHDRRAVVHITDTNGRSFSATSDFAAGHPRNPATWPDIARKFITLSAKVLPLERCHALVAEIEHLEDCDDVGRWVGRLR
jgi:2-methylcitrate dehydratase PrpD